MFEQLGLIGCGLIGGSFALALREAGLVKRVVGYSKSPTTTEKARQLGVIDIEAPSALLATSGADLVLLAVPVAATEATLRNIREMLNPDVLVMDVGSTKVDVADAARRTLRDQIGSFVPAHPVAGREVSGVEHADASLEPRRHYGSSPPARGTHPNHIPETALTRIIPPARGAPKAAQLPAAANRIIPALRGEHGAAHDRPPKRCGSSPPARGARAGGGPYPRHSGIIPACAGSTQRLRAGTCG